MTIYYAIGGGLGHATRARRVIAALDIRDAEIIATGDVPRTLERDREAHRRWLIERFGDHRVIVDSFPAGIQGELSGIDSIHFDYVARLLRWHEYRRTVPYDPPRFATTYVVEELTREHEEFVRANSAAVRPLPLAGEGRREAPGKGRPYSLIVHSGPAEEVHELIAFARELGDERIVVATRCEIEGVERLDTDRPSDYFAGAQRIISAAGFNVMLETEPWREKHHVLPFPRRFDDQYLRAARRRK